MKRKPRAVPTWDDYFMALCFVAASRSRDPSVQQGAVVTDNKHRIQAIGYNDLPACIADSEIDWGRPDPHAADPLKRAGKHPFLVHAEQNAIDQCHGHPEILHESVMYVTGLPCSDCTKRMVAKRIRRVVFGPQNYNTVTADDWQNTKELCKLANIQLDRYAGNLNWLRDRLMWMEQHMTEVFQPMLPMPL